MDWNIQQMLAQVQAIITVYGMKVLAALAILVVGRLAAGLVRRLLRGAATKTKADTTIATFLANIGYVGILIFAAIAALGQLGVETASFIAVLGAAGLAVGLAFQGSLANLAAGLLMVIFRPFRVGDFIEGAGVSGKVKDIQVFTTTISTLDNKKVIVPNSKLTGENIINYTAEPTRRVDLVVGVSYADDLDKVKSVLADTVKSFPGVLPDPEPQIAVSAMADSSVILVVRPWAKTTDYWTIYFGLTEAIKKRFDQEGITIPFPQHDVHMHQDSGE